MLLLYYFIYILFSVYIISCFRYGCSTKCHDELSTHVDTAFVQGGQTTWGEGYIISMNIIVVVASATEGGRRSFSSRLCAGYLKKLRTDSDEIWSAGWVCDREELIKFW